MISQKVSKPVTPEAELISLDSRVRGNNENGSVIFYEFVIIDP